MKLAVIPARGGSKRIARKNIRLFAGEPIIAFSIRAAQDTGLFDRIIVSTDDEEIARVAEAHGAQVPFRRPPALADDSTTTLAVMQHALGWAQEAGLEFELVSCLYPASPLMRAGDVRDAHDMLVATGADYCFPVTTFPSPIQRALRIRADGRVEMFEPQQLNVRSQDLEPAYHDAGQFYWGRVTAYTAGLPMFGPGSVPLRIPSWRVQDIDTEEDWARVELLYELLTQRGEL
jgi:pseudaminic acid cytidylyltransferase